MTSATTVRKAAEARLAAAQQAVDNLNADVATKTKALEDAKSVQAKAVAADKVPKQLLLKQELQITRLKQHLPKLVQPLQALKQLLIKHQPQKLYWL